MALLKLCRCGKKIPNTLKMCPECVAKQQERRRDSDREYDRNKRDKKSKDFYNSSSWEKTRLVVMSKYKGLDLYEYYVNHSIVYAQTVHHIVELREDWSRRHDVMNLIPLTNSNHKRIHLMYENDKESTQKMLTDILNKAVIEMCLG